MVSLCSVVEVAGLPVAAVVAAGAVSLLGLLT